MAEEWFANYDRHFGIKPEDTGGDEAIFIQRMLRIGRGQTVLDVPCGSGRIGIRLARQGILVTGVDATAGYIRRARSRFAREHLPGKFFLRDMRCIEFHEEFDAAFNWQGSFGYFNDLENLGFLRKMVMAVKKGGRILVDQRSREYTLRHFQASHIEGDVTSRMTWNRRTQQMISEFTDRRTRHEWKMLTRFYTPAQFRELFEAAGLKVEAISGDLAGGEFTRRSKRIYVLGRKM